MTPDAGPATGPTVPLRAQPISTERLTLLPLTADHADEMTGVLSDPALYGFIGGTPPTLQELRARYARMIAGSPDPAVSWCNWVIRVRDGQPYAAGDLAGTVQATAVPDGSGTRAEIAWVVGTPWQGRGFATEAARALAGWLGTQGVHTLIAHVHPAHTASAAVAAAAGLAPSDESQDGETRWRLSLTRPSSPPVRCPGQAG